MNFRGKQIQEGQFEIAENDYKPFQQILILYVDLMCLHTHHIKYKLNRYCILAGENEVVG